MNAPHLHAQALCPPGRISQLDIARGVAVVLMIVGHSIDSVLGPGPRLTEAFRYYEILRGLTAPLFLLLAGFAFTVATVKHWDSHRRLGTLTMRRFLRAALLLSMGYVLHLPFFSFGKLLLNAGAEDYASFLQVDVLHCVALSLAALQLTVLVARTPQRHMSMMASLAVLIACAAPFVWALDLDGALPRALIPYLNQQYRSLFPLVPYAAYMFLGAAVGHTYLQARAEGRQDQWARRMILGTGALVGAGIVGELLPWTVYPVENYWRTNPAVLALRAGSVMALMVGLLMVRRVPHRLMGTLMVLGQSSLFVYVAHLVLVYGSVANLGLADILGQDLSVAAAALVAASVLLAMTTLAYGFRYLRTTHRVHLRLAQASAVTLLMYLFVTRPY